MLRAEVTTVLQAAPADRLTGTVRGTSLRGSSWSTKGEQGCRTLDLRNGKNESLAYTKTTELSAVWH